MRVLANATIAYEGAEGVETTRGTELIYDEDTAHWEYRPNPDTVVSIPRERVFRIEGTPASSSADSPDASKSDDTDQQDTDEYGHPL